LFLTLPLTFIDELVVGIITLFVILDPVGVLPFFLNLTKGATIEKRKELANRAVLVAMVLLLAFAYLGYGILGLLGISIYDFEIAGGLLLLIFALRDALSSEPLGVKETSDALSSNIVLDTVAVIPIATPLLAGPGSLATVMLLTKGQYGLLVGGAAILVDCLLAWLALRLSNMINERLGPTTLLIIGKVMDILMAAIAVSFLTKGVLGLGL
jgi:multiple antibiotic resistance protein